MSLGIIIQARTGSTRLPNKMLVPFYKNQTILDIILQRIKTEIKNVPIIVATTNNEKDDELELIAKKNSVLCFRGSETDVLKRFVDAARFYNVDSIIRVCADNPFLSMESLKQLINYTKNKEYEYISFKTSDDIPSIKTHFGFWTEYVTLNALIKVQQATNESLFHEHVTNYIYTHKDLFSMSFINIPTYIEKSKIRLTVDTKDDFMNAGEIYKQLIENKKIIEPENIIPIVTDEIKLSMENQIKLNSK